ncbi:hypothetical protein H5410_037562 [Solanum commersonii]|uniref:Uncharacterized protein n=1 Tax=Solanum commersonii TaxID=4109 RepID=A0A9J5Y8C1_SOLCO|nr:hypothetical protein H5410_037562 [Solanum commersonii]
MKPTRFNTENAINGTASIPIPWKSNFPFSYFLSFSLSIALSDKYNFSPSVPIILSNIAFNPPNHIALTPIIISALYSIHHDLNDPPSGIDSDIFSKIVDMKAITYTANHGSLMGLRCDKPACVSAATHFMSCEEKPCISTGAQPKKDGLSGYK